MKRRILLIMVLEVACLVGGTAFAATIHVPSDQPTIQDGIDAADEGDTVLVADGTYTYAGNIDLDFQGKAITVRSENGPENCIIHGLGSRRGFYFHSGEGESSEVRGFTIMNARAWGDSIGLGGAIYCGDPDFPNGAGGCSPTIAECVITGSTADSKGGGIYCSFYSNPTIINCIISDNTAYQGGGIYSYLSSPTIANCTISGNAVGNSGGGIYCDISSPVVTNCTIIGNDVQNFGGGIYWDASSPIVTNCILWGNSWGEIHPETTTATYCDVEGGYPGEGNIDADPLFVDPETGDFHLLAYSPCIDAGDNDAPGLPATDFEGDPRIIDSDNDGTDTVDIGTDEYAGAYPRINKLRPRSCLPNERIRIIGAGFGDTQGDSLVHIGNKNTYDADSSRIKLWTDTKIKVKIPYAYKKCSWFKGGDGEYRKQKVWVTVDGVESNKKTLKVLKPADCE